MTTSCYDIAQRFVGVKETAGATSTPVILAMLQLDGDWPKDDQVPWCSGFANWVAWLLRLPRSKSLAARSWLQVGRPIRLEEAEAKNDVVILSRDGGGHVGFFAGVENDQILILGGNQSDQVNVSPFPRSRLLGVRRLAD